MTDSDDKVPHDEIIARAVEIVANTDQQAVVNAFVGSLSTRNLPARSAFGSYATLRHLPSHEFAAEDEETGMPWCDICATPEEAKFPWSVSAVERYPSNAFHYQLLYSASDLLTFPTRDVDEPTDEDREILRNILQAIRDLPEDAQLSQLQKAPMGLLKSNKWQRVKLLEVFGVAGILLPPGHRSWREEWLNYIDHAFNQPPQMSKREWAYPVRFWEGTHGVNDEAVADWFGEELASG